MYHYLMIFRSSLSSFIMMNTSVSTRVIKVTTLIFGIPHVCPCCAVYTLHILPPHSPHEHIHTAIVVCNLFCHFFQSFYLGRERLPFSFLGTSKKRVRISECSIHLGIINPSIILWYYCINSTWHLPVQ